MSDKAAGNVGASIEYRNSYQGEPRSYTNSEWKHQIRKMRKNEKLIRVDRTSRNRRVSSTLGS